MFTASSNAQSAGNISAAVTIPTVVVSVTNTYGLAASSPASFALYNGGNAVAVDANGNTTVTQPTDIRFVFANSGTYQFQPIGISFKQTDSNGSDQTGTLNFSIGSLGHAALVLHDNLQTASNFEYSIVFQRLMDC